MTHGTTSIGKPLLSTTALAMTLAACTITVDREQTDFDAHAAIDQWVAMWNSYDLDLVDELFLTDSNVTYLSSEREGAITGIAAVREHHAGFGFVSGGEPPDSRLWVEDLEVSMPAGIAIVTGVWYFRRGPDATGELQRGPVTFVYVPTDDGFRIAHAHFADY
jgi:hypothetical protein